MAGDNIRQPLMVERKIGTVTEETTLSTHLDFAPLGVRRIQEVDVRAWVQDVQVKHDSVLVRGWTDLRVSVEDAKRGEKMDRLFREDFAVPIRVAGARPGMRAEAFVQIADNQVDLMRNEDHTYGAARQKTTLSIEVAVASAEHLAPMMPIGDCPTEELDVLCLLDQGKFACDWAVDMDFPGGVREVCCVGAYVEDLKIQGGHGRIRGSVILVSDVLYRDGRGEICRRNQKNTVRFEEKMDGCHPEVMITADVRVAEAAPLHKGRSLCGVQGVLCFEWKAWEVQGWNVVTDYPGRNGIKKTVDVLEMIGTGREVLQLTPKIGLPPGVCQWSIKELTATLKPWMTWVGDDEVEVEGVLWEEICLADHPTGVCVVCIPFRGQIYVPGARPGMTAFASVRLLKKEWSPAPNYGYGDDHPWQDEWDHGGEGNGFIQKVVMELEAVVADPCCLEICVEAMEEHEELPILEPEYPMAPCEMPEYEMPPFEGPDFETPECGMYEHEMPEYEMPEHEMPEYEMPEYEMPSSEPEFFPLPRTMPMPMPCRPPYPEYACQPPVQEPEYCPEPLPEPVPEPCPPPEPEPQPEPEPEPCPPPEPEPQPEPEPEPCPPPEPEPQPEPEPEPCPPPEPEPQPEPEPTPPPPPPPIKPIPCPTPPPPPPPVPKPPQPCPPPTPGPRPCMKFYFIKKGDSFWKIGQRYGVTVEALQELNPGVDPMNLQIGSAICLPPYVHAKG